MTGTNLYVNKCKQSRSYFNHPVYLIFHIFSPKNRDNVEKYGKARQTTVDNMM